MYANAKNKFLANLDACLWPDGWMAAPEKFRDKKQQLLSTLPELAQKVPAVNSRPKTGRLALVTSTLNSGGAERQWCYLALELSRRGYDVWLLITHSLSGENGHYLPLLKGSRVKTVIVSEVATPEVCDLNLDASYEVLSLENVLRFLKPDAVFSQMDYNNVWSAAAALIMENAAFPVLCSFRCVNPSNFWFCEPYYRDFYKEIIKSPRVRLNANAKSNAEDYARWLDIGPERISITHNAVHLPEIDPANRARVRESLGAAQDENIILGVFRLTDQKQPFLFWEVARKIHSVRDDVIFMVAGIGDLEQALRNVVEASGAANWFRLLGQRNDINALMQASDIFLLCSKFEGLPNVLLEAQANQLPIVSTSVGGVSDAVLKDKTAFLGDDAKTLASHCLRLLQDRAMAEKMGKAGREFVETAFSPTSVADSFLRQVDLPLKFSGEPAPLPTPGSVPFKYWIWLERLKSLLERHNYKNPLLVFSPFPLTRKIYELLPRGSVWLVLPWIGSEDDSPAVSCDWAAPRSWEKLKQYVKPGMEALVFNQWPTWEDVEPPFREMGIRWITCWDERGWVRFPALKVRFFRHCWAIGRAWGRRLLGGFPKMGKSSPAHADRARLETMLDSLPSREPSPSARAGLPEICLLEGWLGPGGAERQLSRLAVMLKERGHKVRVRVAGLSGRGAHYLPYLLDNGIDVREVRQTDRAPAGFGRLVDSIPPSLRGLACGLASELAEAPCDIVHAYYDHPNIWGAWAAIMAGIPAMRMGWLNREPSQMFYYESFMKPQYKLLLPLKRISAEANARFCAQSYAQWLDYPPDKVEIVPTVLWPRFGIGARERRAEARGSLNVPLDAPVALFSGRLAPEKRPFDMLRVFEKALSKNPQLHCLVAGSDILDAEFNLAVEKISPAIRPRLHVLGLRRDMDILLAASDILLVTSETEGISNAILEAMAMELPIVATRAGAIPELVQDGRNGFLAEIGDVGRLAENLLKLADDRDLRIKMGRESLRLAAPYNEDTQYALLNNFYLKSLGLA